MAYALRYYKELTHPDGTVYRLEIHEKDGTASAMEIGKVVQGLRLDVQGDTEIDAPIVKTSLTMTFVDAPDHAEAKTKKCGNWEEFYTSDATKWQVVMKYRKSGGASFVTMWGGYITPDSYTETLVYRGSVTIIARDNIGHMQDFPFDAEGNADGMISFLDLVYEAWDKIESPMSLVLRDSGDAMWMYTDGVAAYDTMMNVSAFKEKNWLEALEDALYAYGVVMRYVGDNNVSIMPLRSLPMMGEASFDDVPTAEPVFMTGAERELTPAVRRIEETQDVETGEHYYNVTDVEYSGAVNDVTNVWDGTSRNISYPLIATSATSVGWYNRNKDKSLAFNAKANTTYLTGTDKETILAYPCILAGVANDDSYSVSYGININSYDIDIHVKFGRFISRGTYTDGSTSIEFDRETVSEYTVRYAVRVVNKGITYYLSQGGSLVTSQQYIETVVSNEALNIPLRLRSDIIGETYVAVDFYHIEIGESLKPKQVLSISVDNADARPIITSNHVNTNYKSDNNVVLSRDPQIVPALSDVALPDFFTNGIFRQVGYLYESAKLWAWPDGSTAQQMAVYNHLQLLCYHAKPNSVIRGTIVNADLAKMSVIYSWQGLEMMLVSGSLNFISGYLENAVLREFARYEDMWGLLDPADLPDVDGSSVTNAESGSASKSEGARNTINTEVYLGGGNIVLDDYMSDSSENGVMNRVIKAYVDNLWHLDDNGNVCTDRNVIIAGDTSSGGEGEDTPTSGIRGIYVNGTPYTDTDGDGFIDLGTISGGVSGDYLPLTGGILNGSLQVGQSDNTGYKDISVVRNGVTTYMATTGAGEGYFGAEFANGNFAALVLTDGVPRYGYNDSYYTLIHSGNIGSQSVSHATTTNRFKYIASAGDLNTVLAGGGLARTYSNYMSNIFTNAPSGMRYGMVLQLSAASAGTEALSGQLAWDVNHGSTSDVTRYLWWRASDTSNGFKYGKWHQIAFTDSNVASATKLATARTIWGQSFDGTGNVSGALSGVTNINGAITINSSGNVGIGTVELYAANKLRLVNTHYHQHTWSLGSLANESDFSVEFRDPMSTSRVYGLYTSINYYTGYVAMQVGRSDGLTNAYGLILQPLGGNVLIGTTTDSGYKLNVNGVTKASAFYSTAIGIECDANGNTSGYGSEINRFGANLYLQTREGNLYLSHSTGTTFICGLASITGAVTMSSSLSVGGNTTINGNLVVSGDTSSGSDIRFKNIIKDKTIKIEHIAKAPLFTFKWNDRDDDTIHLGSSAQYWEKVTPWLVTGEDFKSLNYATLGVAMGISLAKKAVNHEERIKELEAEIKRLKEERYGDR